MPHPRRRIRDENVTASHERLGIEASGALHERRLPLGTSERLREEPTGWHRPTGTAGQEYSSKSEISPLLHSHLWHDAPVDEMNAEARPSKSENVSLSRDEQRATLRHEGSPARRIASLAMSSNSRAINKPGNSSTSLVHESTPFSTSIGFGAVLGGMLGTLLLGGMGSSRALGLIIGAVAGLAKQLVDLARTRSQVAQAARDSNVEHVSHVGSSPPEAPRAQSATINTDDTAIK
jgi:F0F1-type ATP synthase assembly protein I